MHFSLKLKEDKICSGMPMILFKNKGTNKQKHYPRDSYFFGDTLLRNFKDIYEYSLFHTVQTTFIATHK